MDYGTTTVTTTSTEFDAGAFMAFLAFYFIFILIAYVIHAIFLGMIFKKAGVESWKAWVPVYNSWVLLEIGKQPGWWALLMFVPIVQIAAIVFFYIAMYQIGLSLQKEGWFVLLAIFIPTVWVIWLALDSSTWQDGGQSNQTPASVPPTTPDPVV